MQGVSQCSFLHYLFSSNDITSRIARAIELLEIHQQSAECNAVLWVPGEDGAIGARLESVT